MSPSPNKRKRTVSQDSNSPPDINPSPSKPLTRSEHFYLEDGNIVLAAEDVAFRVHRSQLSHHSEVFRDMLEVVAQPLDAEVFDGCPVVRLFDTPKDVLELLRALYVYVRFDPNKTDQLTCVLRLSTKYLIDHLRVATIECLSEPYPATLEDYDRYYTGNSKEDGAKCSDIVKLAHDVHAEILLPAAYYRLWCCPAEELVAFGLPPTILQKYFLGKEKMATMLGDFVKAKILHRDFESNHLECLQLSTCPDIFKDIESEVFEMLADTITIPNPLYGIQTIAENSYDSGFSRLCQACRVSLTVDIESGRQKIWASLPGIFNMGSWGELLKTA